MKFRDMPYKRPDLTHLAGQIELLAQKATDAQNGEEILSVYRQFRQISDDISTAGTLVQIRHTVDTTDEYYDTENDYFDTQGPIVEDKSLSLYRSILSSEHKNALSEVYGDILLEKLEISVKSSDERLISLQQEENALATQYEKLYASAKIPFQGKVLTVSQLGPYKQHIDRTTRKEAFEAEGGFFDKNSEELDDIYQKMVQNRTKQAKTLGHDTFTPLGDIRMQRHGYTRSDIKACREAVISGIVPMVQKLKQEQATRIDVSDFRFYDDLLSFKDGNPTPKGTPEEILAAGQKMYRDLSPETSEFIDFMMDNDLFDVLSKPGKAPGGYCTYIPTYKSPFIFSNFNGTAGDVDVLTHEAGHAFAAYLAAKQNLVGELSSPGLESCEIHSMAMEFLTEKSHHLFFGEDTQKYAISHAEDALFFLPYGCQVDEFQETVYDNPTLTPAQRHSLWLDLERKYRPWNNFDNLPFYSRGAGWQRQLHIYTAPFYYIDYVLAQIIAIQFFLAHNQDPKDAWKRYLALTEKGGTATYTGLVSAAGLSTPFKASTMEKVGKDMAAWIKQQ